MKTTEILNLDIKLFFYGIFDGLTIIYLGVIGPLLVAANNRKTFEITMGGTMIAVVSMTTYIFSQTITSMLIHSFGAVYNGGERNVILLLFFVEVIPFLINARKEYLELKLSKDKKLSYNIFDAHL
jgi:hypothetical protein